MDLRATILQNLSLNFCAGFFSVGVKGHALFVLVWEEVALLSVLIVCVALSLSDFYELMLSFAFLRQF